MNKEKKIDWPAEPGWFLRKIRRYSGGQILHRWKVGYCGRRRPSVSRTFIERQDAVDWLEAKAAEIGRPNPRASFDFVQLFLCSPWVFSATD